MKKLSETKDINILNGSPMPISEFLDFAISISAALLDIHKNTHIHGAVCPENIIWEPKKKHAKLADPTNNNEKALFSVDRLPYISPEQTGRMNRQVDYRTDLYSLGVVFYEMLVGEPPFVADDTMEMIHLHIASVPPTPQTKRAEVPEQISAIVMRLLEKNADDRYKSAHGLQHDLEQCARQWKKNGSIKRFELGRSDLTGIFRIPQKLYGRENELKILLDSFERISGGGTELFMVAGYSGVGKSMLVREVQKPIIAKRGFFIEGKFDQYQRNIPYFAWQQAFRILVNNLLMESNERLAGWKTRILEAVGSNGKVLTDIILNLELVIGRQPEVLLLSGAEAQNRFNSVFQNFVKILANKEHPLVIFLDDLHWIDTASLKLLEVLITDPDLSYVQLIGTYRDNEVDAAHPLIVFLESLEDDQAVLKQITLQNLQKKDVNTLIADSLQASHKDTQPIAELIYSKTEGNAFFTHQILHTLRDENLLTFEPTAKSWHWDMEALRALNITENVVELLSSSMRKLPSETQEVLILAACIGNQFTPDTLSLITGKKREDIEGTLKLAVQEGIIIAINAYYKFAHDRLQQAAYSLIPEELKKETHLKIGRILLKRIPEDERKDRIFDIVNHLNIGVDLLSAPTEQIQLATLNLAAGKKAKATAAYSDAKKYIEIGIELLGTGSWEEQYELTLSLHNENGELAASTGQYDQISTTADLIHANAIRYVDRMRIYMAQIEAETMQYKFAKALEIGLEALKYLGFDIPAQPDAEDYQRLKDRLVTALASKPKENLVELPEMTDEIALAVSSLLAAETTTAYMSNPLLYPIIVYQGAILTLEFGLNAWSPMLFGDVAFLNLSLIDLETPTNVALDHIFFAKQLQQIAQEMMKKTVTAKSQTKTLVRLAATSAWTEPNEKGIELAKATYLSGYENGDMLNSSFGAIQFAKQAFAAGMNLVTYQNQLSNFIDSLSRMGQKLGPQWLAIQLQLAQNFRETLPDPDKLCGIYFDEDKWLPRALALNDLASRHNHSICKLLLAYYFDVGDRLDKYASEAEDLISGGRSNITMALFYFYFALSKIRLAWENSTKDDPGTINLVNSYLQLMAIWSKATPSTFQHKYDLIAAEKARVLGDLDSALTHYEQAIKGARDHGFIHEEALACELYARFWIERDNNRFAAPLMQEAHNLYLKWGAVAKADHLMKRYPNLLITKSNADLGIGNLDLRTVLKASQAISGEIALDKLLAKMMQIVIENAGAQHGFLILEQGNEWIIQAIAEVDKSNVQVLQSIRIEDNDIVSAGIINYVASTQETVVLMDATNEGNFTSDETIQRLQSRSVLCTPLINQGELSGILYLDNNLTTGAFNLERVELLKLLSSEMALALDNAKVYHDLEQSEKRFRVTFEQAAVGVAHVAPDGKFLRINSKFSEIIGYNSDEMLALTFQDITYPDDLDKDVGHARQLLKGETNDYTIEKRYIQKDGSIIWVNLTVSLLRGESGEPVFFVSVVEDITQRKNIEQALLKYQRRLKDLAHQVTITEELTRKRIAVDLHDHVGQLLASMRVQLAKVNTLEENPEIIERIDNISQALRTAIQATRDAIFDLSLPQLNEIGLYAAVHDWMKEQIELKHEITTSISGEAVNIDFDENTRFLLFRSIRELMINVVKHAQATILNVDFAHKDENIVISVKDDGIGFNYSPHFLQLKSSGYGLFSIQERLSDLGGMMEVDSSNGKGTLIKIMVPLKN